MVLPKDIFTALSPIFIHLCHLYVSLFTLELIVTTFVNHTYDVKALLIIVFKFATRIIIIEVIKWTNEYRIIET